MQKNETLKNKFNKRDVLKTTKHCLEKLKEMYKWREICEKLCSWVRRHNSIMKTTLASLIYKVNAIYIESSREFFCRKWQVDPKCKRCRIPETILKNNKAVDLSLPYFKTCFKAIAIKIL